MRVLMFGWEFPPHITGGLGTACFGLTKGLAKHDVDMIFVVPKAYGDEDQSAVRIVNASDVVVDYRNSAYKEFWKRIEYMEIGSTIVPYVSPEEWENHKTMMELDGAEESQHVLSKRYEFSGKYGPTLMEEVSRYALIAGGIASEKNFDIIHAHDWLAYPAGIAAKKVSGKPLVIHVHATEYDRTGENVNTIVWDIEKGGMDAADHIIAVSNLTKNICVNKYGIDPDKITVVHNAVEPSEKEKCDKKERAIKEKIITFLGRITYQKGPEYFIEAAYKVLQRDNNVRFVMAGSGDMHVKMIRRVAQLKIADKFHFTGFLKGDEVDEMFALSDVFVMPSVSEPFGIVPLEAMRLDVPVIISKQSGVSEILNYAIKVDFWDIDATADAMHALISYEALAETFKKYGKDEVNSLKWENAAFKVKDIYSDVINNLK